MEIARAHHRENKINTTNPQLKKFRRFLVSSSFALMMTLHPPVAFGQESSSGSETPIEETGPSVTEVEAPTPIVPLNSWFGTATYYSKAGCVGCSRNQIMANGRPFNEDALTIAFMKADLGCIVHVTNQDNGLGVDAEVTDRGGFEAYHHIADLSKGTRNAIGGSWITAVRIDLLYCKQR